LGCQGREGSERQFEQYPEYGATIPFQEIEYCQLLFPLNCAQKFDASSFVSKFTVLENYGHMDFIGLIFPGPTKAAEWIR